MTASASTPPGLRVAAVVAVVLMGGGCARDRLVASACLHHESLVEVEREHEATFSKDLELIYTFPEGRQPSRTTLQATTYGPLARIFRGDHAVTDGCLIGDLLLQRGRSTIDVMTQTGTYILDIEYPTSGGTVVEVEANGDGVHVTSSVYWNWNDVPAPLRPEAEQAVERWFVQNEHRRADVWPDLVGTFMQVQWGSATRRTYGRLSIDAFLQSSDGVNGDVVSMIYADFEILDNGARE